MDTALDVLAYTFAIIGIGFFALLGGVMIVGGCFAIHAAWKEDRQKFWADARVIACSIVVTLALFAAVVFTSWRLEG